MNKKSVKFTVIKAILSIVVIFLMFWFELPPLNLRSSDFWSFLIQAIIVCVVINAFGYIWKFIKKLGNSKGGTYAEITGEKFSIKKLGKPIVLAIGAAVIIVVFSFVMNTIGSEFFNAKSYNQLLSLKDGDFASDVSELKMNQIPVVDRDSSQTLGKRKLGEISDYVSQFEIADNYTQINYKDEPCRVTPLVYGDPIKWFNNQKEGIPAYIIVNMTTQDADTVRLESGMKYSESEYFMRNIHRYLRFNYPTKIFDDVSFEIDENGTPYWVASTIEYKIAFWSGRDIGGAVLVNAVTGESKYYDLKDIPTWVDQVYSADMIIEQLEYNGEYRSGFWNSVFGQKGVLQPTEGYNYLAINDDVWLYTGMTSVVSDESNVGFVLVNLRTKESKYYKVPGAKEYSAMSSAEGAVQEKEYSATFPLLLNVSDRPTYFMSLKDDAGLVKMYAFVDVQAYQVLGTGSNVDQARENYISNLKKEEIELNPEDEKEFEEITESFKVTDVNSAVVGGNTKYYLKVKSTGENSLGYDSEILVIDISVSEDLPFVKAGEEAVISFKSDEDDKITVSGFELK